MTTKTQVSQGATAVIGTSPTTASAARCDATVRDATCRTCPFWQERPGRPEGSGRGGYGLCHHAHAAAEAEPTRYGDWWCSEHPLRQRDRLAAMAMSGLLACNLVIPADVEADAFLADQAYRLADAMLARRTP